MAFSFGAWRGCPEAPLHVAFLVHFLFSSWSHLGDWSGRSLMFQDVTLLFCLAWAAHSKRDPTPVFLALGVNALAVFLDIIVLAVSFPRRNSTEEYSAVMAIFNLILRLASSYILWRSFDLREGFDGSPPEVEEPHPTHVDVTHDSGRVSRSSSRASANNNGHYGSYNPNGGGQKQREPLPEIPPSYSQHY